MPSPVLHVTGARPNFPKSAPVIEALRRRGVEQLLIHTGQHFDDNMSAVFFRELDLPPPDVNLGVGSGTHAQQTAAMMVALEELFESEKPALVVVYGDVNSTLAAALVAAKMCIPLAHVEAGLRSFDWSMPEEVNRVVTDRLCDLLLVTSPDAIAHLGREGVATERIHFVGNPMIDTLLKQRPHLHPRQVADQLGLPAEYAVATLHRPGNVDDPASLAPVVAALRAVADEIDVVLPVHPRGRARLEASGLFEHARVHSTEPLGYRAFLGLVDGSSVVITDSGGIQEETTVLGIPCLTMRPNTERPVTISHGTNRLVTPGSLLEQFRGVRSLDPRESWPVPPLWDGRAGERIADVIADFVGRRG
jgi:UDP-N-acetylglucosamine 2-epimerase (non-hydrolysing)